MFPRERALGHEGLDVADDLRGHDADLGLPDLFPHVRGLVGGHVEAQDLRERHLLDVDDGEAGEAPGLEGHHLREGRASVHAQVLNHPADDVDVRLLHRALSQPRLDLPALNEAAQVLPPGPRGLGGEEVELALDAVRQVVGKAVGVAEARVGVPRAQLGVHALLALLGEEGGLESVPQPGAQRHHLHALEAEVEPVLLALGGDDAHGLGEGGLVHRDALRREHERQGAQVRLWQVLGVVEAGEELHGGLARAPGEHAAGQELHGVHGLQPLHHLQDQHAARGGPAGGVQVVRPQPRLDLREEGVAALNLGPVLVGEPGPLHQAEQAEPRLRVAQRVVAGPQHALHQRPVGVVVREEGLEEGPPVQELEGEHGGLDQQGGEVLGVHVVLVACLQQPEHEVSVIHVFRCGRGNI